MTGKRFKDKKFLEWAQHQGGECCVCRVIHGDHKPAVELHHFGKSGVGMKGRDHFVARLCREHHSYLQGKGRIWFSRGGNWEVWTAMLEDALNLLSDYVLQNGAVEDVETF